jgi:hypothetical protein
MFSTSQLTHFGRNFPMLNPFALALERAGLETSTCLDDFAPSFLQVLEHGVLGRDVKISPVFQYWGPDFVVDLHRQPQKLTGIWSFQTALQFADSQSIAGITHYLSKMKKTHIYERIQSLSSTGFFERRKLQSQIEGYRKFFDQCGLYNPGRQEGYNHSTLHPLSQLMKRAAGDDRLAWLACAEILFQRSVEEESGHIHLKDAIVLAWLANANARLIGVVVNAFLISAAACGNCDPLLILKQACDQINYYAETSDRYDKQHKVACIDSAFKEKVDYAVARWLERHMNKEGLDIADLAKLAKIFPDQTISSLVQLAHEDTNYQQTPNARQGLIHLMRNGHPIIRLLLDQQAHPWWIDIRPQLEPAGLGIPLRASTLQTFSPAVILFSSLKSGENGKPFFHLPTNNGEIFTLRLNSHPASQQITIRRNNGVYTAEKIEGPFMILERPCDSLRFLHEGERIEEGAELSIFGNKIQITAQPSS